MSHRLLTTQDLADRLGISSTILHEWRQQGRGPCFVQIGGMIRYPAHEVELFERRFKSRSDWVVGRLATEPDKRSDKGFSGRLRRPGFSERRVDAIIKAYLDHLLCPAKNADLSKAIDDYARLMALEITARDLADGRIEIDKEQLNPEVLFVDLLNTLNKWSGNLNKVLEHAQEKLTDLDPVALQCAVDRFGDLSTRKLIRRWAGRLST